MFIGLAWTAVRAKPRQAEQVVGTGLVALAGGLLGGRVVYVVVQWEYFRFHPAEALQPWLGGFSGPGALLGGILALAMTARLARQPLPRLADTLLPLFGLLAVTGWIGCWMAGCAYGPQVVAWWSLPTRDEWGTWSARLPLQWIGALLTLGLLWGLDRGRRWPEGIAASLGLTGIGLELFALSFLRADPVPVWADLRLDTWAGLSFALLGSLALGWLVHRSRQKQEIAE